MPLLPLKIHQNRASYGGHKLDFTNKFGVNKLVPGSEYTTIDNILSHYNGEGEPFSIFFYFDERCAKWIKLWR